jgi:hypothetical protein
MLLGMNANPPYYGTGPTPYADLMLNADHWQDTNDAFKYWVGQDQGIVTGNSVPHELCAVLAGPAEQLPAGTYTVRNPGGASLSFGTSGGSKNLATSVSAAGAFTTATSFTVTLTANSGLAVALNGNLSQKITVLLPGHVTSYDGGDLFNSAWVSFHSNTQVLRTMDLTGVNYSLEEVWADRSVNTKCFYRNFLTGFPIEAAIAAANKLNKPLWLNIPSRATDAWVTSCASLVSANLSSGLSVYLEYVNEIWNGGNIIFSANTEWVRHLGHTRLLATVSGTTLTRTAHGFTNSQALRGFNHKGNRGPALANADNTGAINSYYPAINGGLVYVKVLTVNTFELYPSAALTAGQAQVFPAAFTQIWLINPSEAGKTVDLDVNYATRSKQIWDIFDTALGSSRVKTIMGTQNSYVPLTTNRMAVAAAAARTNYVAPAPYFLGITQGAAIDRTTGSFLGKFWTTDGGTSTVRMSVYASGSTPRKDQIKAGTGTGLVAGGSVSWTATYGGSAYTSAGSAVTGLSNGTSYLVWFCVTDSSGYDWFWSQTVAAANVTDTVDVLDTYANQKTRALLDITGAIPGASDTYTTLLAHRTAAVAVNSATRVFAYEGQNHQDYSRPTAITTWWDAWLEDQTYADVLKTHLNLASAADAAGYCIYSDINATGAWGTADSNYDTADLRHVAVNSFSGTVTKRTVVDLGASVDGGTLAADPGSYPYTFYTFPNSALTYEILNGDNEGNYSVSGANVRLSATTGITWSAPANHVLKMRATDGYTDDIFNLSFVTGAGWYPSDSKFVLDMVTQSNAALLTADIGGNLTRAGSGGTFAAGMLDTVGTASYSNTAGMTSTTQLNVPILFSFVFDGDDQGAANSDPVVKFGVNPTFDFWTGSSLCVFQLFDAGYDQTHHFARPVGKFVFSAFYDPSALTVTLLTNKTQPSLNTGPNPIPITSRAASTLARDVNIGADQTKKGSILMLPRAGMTLSDALTVIQGIMTHHSIP